MMKRILVTGGAGFIGSHLVQHLVAEHYQVVVLDDLSTGHMANLDPVIDRIEFIKGDISDEGVVTEAIQGCDTVFHQAAMVSVPETVAKPIRSALVNDLGTLYLLNAARDQGVRRMVLASSCAIYGDDPLLPKREEMAPQPLTPYAVQKLTGEHYARCYFDLYGLETVALRYFNVYGPRQDPSSPYSGVISIFLTKAAADSPPVIYGDGDQYRDFVFVTDVVAANLAAAQSPAAAGQHFNIGTGATVSVNRLWEMTAALSGTRVQPIHEAARAGDIRESRADIAKANKLLGFIPRIDFEEGLAQTFQWYQNQPSAR